jgi:hypothetical protein
MVMEPPCHHIPAHNTLHPTHRAGSGLTAPSSSSDLPPPEPQWDRGVYQRVFLSEEGASSWQAWHSALGDPCQPYHYTAMAAEARNEVGDVWGGDMAFGFFCWVTEVCIWCVITRISCWIHGSLRVLRVLLHGVWG